MNIREDVRIFYVENLLDRNRVRVTDEYGESIRQLQQIHR